MAKRKATDSVADHDALSFPPVKASRLASDEATWTLPADAPRIILPVDRGREHVHLLADLSLPDSLFIYTGSDTGTSGQDVANIEQAEEDDEEDGDVDDEGHANEEQAVVAISEEQAVTAIPPLGLPNAQAIPSQMSRQEEERLIALHIEPLRPPNLVEDASGTDAPDDEEQTGLSLQSPSTLDITTLFTNTGASKGRFLAGVDPGTHYPGEVMLFPTGESEEESFSNNGLTTAKRDEPRGYVDAETQTGEDTDVSLSARLSNLWSAVLPLRPKRVDSETASRRSKVSFTFTALKTSSKPTFVRVAAREGDGDTRSAATSYHDPSLFHLSPPEEGTMKEELPSAVSTDLRAKMQATGVPRNQNQLDMLVNALAETMNILSGESYLGMYGGNDFNVRKEMPLYTPLLGRHDFWLYD